MSFLGNVGRFVIGTVEFGLELLNQEAKSQMHNNNIPKEHRAEYQEKYREMSSAITDAKDSIHSIRENID